jgi:hypothetical protein
MADKVVRVDNGVKVRIDKQGQYYWDFGTKERPGKLGRFILNLLKRARR